MTTITDQLADALRIARKYIDDSYRPWQADCAKIDEALASYDAQQACGHSACSQNFIDTGSRECVQAGDNTAKRSPVSVASSHTPEPWAQRGFSIITKDGEKIIADGVEHFDLRRIVACVNACAGIPTAELETAAGDHGLLMDWIQRNG